MNLVDFRAMARPAERRRTLRLVSTLPLGVAVVSVVAALAACGGGSNASSNPGSPSYDPATTTLHDAGLQVCSQTQRNVPPALTTIPGLGLTRSFDVAKDCKGAKTTPNTMTVFQFTNVNDFNSGTQSIKSALPNASVLPHYPLVIVATGPDREANLAAVEKQLPPSTVSTTTS